MSARRPRIDLAPVCKWQEDENGNWETECGDMFSLTNGTPHENQMAFCCYCGNELQQIRYKEPPR